MAKKTKKTKTGKKKDTLRDRCEALVEGWADGAYDNFKDVILDCRSLLDELPRATERKRVEQVLTEATSAFQKLVDEDPSVESYAEGLIDPSYLAAPKKKAAKKKAAKKKAAKKKAAKKKAAKKKAAKKKASASRLGFFGHDGELVCELPYFDVSEVSPEGLAAIRHRRYGLVGYCDLSGQLKIEPRFVEAGRFSDQLAPVNVDGKRDGSEVLGGKRGYIDPDGELAIAAEFEAAESFNEGLAAVNVGGDASTYSVIGGSWGYIDTSGTWVLPADGRFSDARQFSEGLAAVELAESRDWGYVDRDGELKILLPPPREEWMYFCYPFNDGRARIVEAEIGSFGPSAKGRYWFIDHEGNEVIPAADGDSFCSDDFSERLAGVKRGDKFGFIDTSGKLAIAAEYAQVYPFSEGLAGVRYKGLKTGFIDHEGALVLPCDYKYATRFVGGVFLAHLQ